MTREEFRNFAHNKTIYLDGATGSNLVKAGMPSGVCPEQWILEHPDVLLRLQEQYVAAGTDILYAPTFTANRIKLAEYGLETGMEGMIRDLVALSRRAAESAVGRPVYVAGDITMTGEQLRPMGTMELETLIDVYKEQIRMLVSAGADLLVVETMMSLAETRAALIAAKEVCELPVMVSFTFEPDGRMLYGTDARTAAIVAESLGACAVGANCSMGPEKMQEILHNMTSVTTIPILAKPNAGIPALDADGNTYYKMGPETFAEEMQFLYDVGAGILGGCCGTTPEHIRGLVERFGKGETPSAPRRPDGIRYLTGERMTVEFGLNGNFMVVGERINPTGKKALQAELREDRLDMVLHFAEEQDACGAQILDINMGMSGIDEKAMMLRVLEEVSGVTNLPLALDSSHVEVLEAALRRYPGRALINSISYEKEKFERLLPIAAKYGAMFILLPLSDKGLPANLEEKKEIIRIVSSRAYELGMRREDIVVDGLVTTVGANGNAALETLETIRYCREQGFATICGLSNISFGMPERSFVNTAFLTLAIREGLTMAIANPSQELLMCCALATDLLLHKEGADLRYIEKAGAVKEAREAREVAISRLRDAQAQAPGTGGDSASAGHPDGAESPAAESSRREKIYNAVLKGNRNGIAQMTRDALTAGEEPDALLNEVLLPAINRVGELFDKGKYFLPQLIAGAEAMKNAIEVLEPLLLKESDGENMPVVVIATVEGDIHDIGKNLVALMLKNYGFRVIDLGKDVPSERIIAAAKEHHAQIIALSALMTTTMQRMREVIADARAARSGAKVMIGGAVITQDYADEIGADGYSKDAADAVKLAKRLTGDG
ncbi:MAG: homocysteine S-methyltransferase family protein [Clostridium sp.]|nr:homocysteine S-methyltransferase family protein [Acetatifactor muris]MCM1527098.1 homocysteine S-methyltransferase family protein [Bacteroides sp.]MCM1563413.1 homocysteine S-methyltransferase family protein [Clostridium sp.]